MKRTTAFAIIAAVVVIALSAAMLWRRSAILESFHRYRLSVEIDAYQNPPIMIKDGIQVRDYTDYSAVESELSKLVALDAIDRLELKIRLYTDGATAPLPSLDRLKNGSNPSPIFFHIKGNPRIQPQTVVIWCERSDTLDWKRFAENSLAGFDQDSGEP